MSSAQGQTSPEQCISNPSSSACASFEYPGPQAKADISTACTARPAMPGCSLWQSCKAGDLAGSPCEPFSLLATLCVASANIPGCENYNALCSSMSRVQQCTKQPPIPRTPSWAGAMTNIQQVCTAMSMMQCESCDSMSCSDPVATLAAMCTEMPMRGCENYYDWCAANGDSKGDLAWYCGGASARVGGGATDSGLDGLGSAHSLLGERLPSMLNYFHSRFEEVILFKSWVPETEGEYAGAVIAIFFMALMSVTLKSLRGLFSISWEEKLHCWSSDSKSINPVEAHAEAARPFWMFASWSQGRECLKAAAFTAPAVTLDYFCMLIAMTFNIGFFVAIVMGYTSGNFLFAHLPENYKRHLKACRYIVDHNDSSSVEDSDSDGRDSLGGKASSVAVHIGTTADGHGTQAGVWSHHRSDDQSTQAGVWSQPRQLHLEQVLKHWTCKLLEDSITMKDGAAQVIPLTLHWAIATGNSCEVLDEQTIGH
eukprot:gene5039-34828_t